MPPPYRRRPHQLRSDGEISGGPSCRHRRQRLDATEDLPKQVSRDRDLCHLLDQPPGVTDQPGPDLQGSRWAGGRPADPRSAQNGRLRVAVDRVTARDAAVTPSGACSIGPSYWLGGLHAGRATGCLMHQFVPAAQNAS